MTKAKKRVKRQPRPVPMPTVSSAQGDVGRNALLLQDMYRAEIRAMAAERELAEIRRKLVSLLNPDQIDAARVCGVTPEFYALECIELYKQTFFPQMPAQLRPLWVLKAPGGSAV